MRRGHEYYGSRSISGLRGSSVSNEQVFTIINAVQHGIYEAQ